MFGDPFLDSFLGAAAFAALLYPLRKRIAVAAIKLFLEVAPVEAIAQVAEKAMSAYIERKEVDLGKGKMGVQYVATDRLKAILAVVAEPLMVEIMKKLKLRVKEAQEGGAVGGMDLGGLLQMFGGGSKGGGGGGDMMQMLEMGMKLFSGGGKQGGQPPQSGGGGVM